MKSFEVRVSFKNSVLDTGTRNTNRTAVCIMTTLEDIKYDIKIGMTNNGTISKCRDSLTKPFNHVMLNAIASSDNESKENTNTKVIRLDRGSKERDNVPKMTVEVINPNTLPR